MSEFIRSAIALQIITHENSIISKRLSQKDHTNQSWHFTFARAQHVLILQVGEWVACGVMTIFHEQVEALNRNTLRITFFQRQYQAVQVPQPLEELLLLPFLLHSFSFFTPFSSFSLQQTRVTRRSLSFVSYSSYHIIAYFFKKSIVFRKIFYT